MSDDLATQLHQLQNLRKLGVLDEDTYHKGLATLRTRYGSAAVDAILRANLPATPARASTQVIGGYATIAAAIAGDVYGDLYIVGERAQSAQALRAGYLRWLASQCGQLPLRGVREQKTATDVLQIGLDQVYTQLATTALVEREVFTGEVLKRFDAQAYLEQHVGEWLLPNQRRQKFRLLKKHLPQRRDNRPITGEYLSPDLDTLSAQELSQFVVSGDGIAFHGPQLVTEAIAASARLVLLGEPGSGKSTALRYLALTLAHAGLDDTLDLSGHLEGWQALGANGRLVPLFMPLLPLARRLAGYPGRNGTAADLWTVIDAHLVDHGATAEVVAAVRTELTQGHVLLLLDGLDEVAGDASRRQVADAVQAFAAEQPQCRIVVACRVRAYQGEQNVAWQLPGWPTATLTDWTPGQVRAFVSAWYAAAAEASRMPAAKRDERTVALQRAVAEREDLRRLSIRPLLLTIMALVHLNDGRLPEDRVSLYARCLDILLAQWEIAGKDETVYGSLMEYIELPDLNVKALRPLLARLAYTAHTAAAPGDVGRLRRADLCEVVMAELARLGHRDPYRGAQKFLDYTDMRSGLLQASAAGDAYTFPHQTFQEYLAGLELVSDVDFIQRIMACRADERWRLPIMLGVGHLVSERALNMPFTLLSELLHAEGRAPEQAQRDLLLAAEIAQDVTWERLEQGGAAFKALRRQLAEAVARVVEGSALPAAERVRAGVLLGVMGDVREGVCNLPPKIVLIAGGTFVIGNTPEEYQRIVEAETPRQLGEEAKRWYRDTVNQQPVVVASFEMAPYPVTNAQYALFVEDDGYNHDRPWWDDAGRSWLTGQRRRQPDHWDDERFGSARPNHPVVGVSWYEATAFCRWLTQHPMYNPAGYVYVLPSEAEWEYAARGTERRPYPWGPEEPDGERANFDNMYDGTTAVGCFPRGATPEGVMDLAGNVWEWTRSEYRPYPYDPGDGCEDSADPAQKSFTFRGGGWPVRPINLRASYRFDNPPTSRRLLGFRLARHPPG